MFLMSYLNNTIQSEYPSTSTSQICNLNILRKRYVDSAENNWTEEKHMKRMNQKRRFYHWTPEKRKVITRMVSYSRYKVTIVTSTSIENQTDGWKEIEMTTETTIRLQESPASVGNAITVEKEAIGLLIVGQRK